MRKIFYYRVIGLRTGLTYCKSFDTNCGIEEFKQTIDIWNKNEDVRFGGRLYTYAYVPTSCVKKIFGSIGWTNQQEWPKD